MKQEPAYPWRPAFFKKLQKKQNLICVCTEANATTHKAFRGEHYEIY